MGDGPHVINSMCQFFPEDLNAWRASRPCELRNSYARNLCYCEGRDRSLKEVFNCTDRDVRLVSGGNSAEGIPEIYLGGRFWPLLRSGIQPDQAEAVCVALGFGGGTIALPSPATHCARVQLKAGETV